MWEKGFLFDSSVYFLPFSNFLDLAWGLALTETSHLRLAIGPGPPGKPTVAFGASSPGSPSSEASIVTEPSKNWRLGAVNFSAWSSKTKTHILWWSPVFSFTLRKRGPRRGRRNLLSLLDSHWGGDHEHFSDTAMWGLDRSAVASYHNITSHPENLHLELGLSAAGAPLQPMWTSEMENAKYRYNGPVVRGFWWEKGIKRFQWLGVRLSRWSQETPQFNGNLTSRVVSITSMFSYDNRNSGIPGAQDISRRQSLTMAITTRTCLDPGVITYSRYWRWRIRAANDIGGMHRIPVRCHNAGLACWGDRHVVAGVFTRR